MDRYQEMERRFAACYQKHGQALCTGASGILQGTVSQISSLHSLFLLKHSPALLSPLLIANVVNGVIEGGEAGSRATFY